MKKDAFLNELLNQREAIAVAAQLVYDGWEPWEDDDYCGGGICDEIARAICEVLGDNIEDIEFEEGGWDGDDHAWVIVIDSETNKRYGVDIDSSIYEVGGGYSWRKIDGAQFTARDVLIGEI